MTLIELDDWIKSMGIEDLSFPDVQVCGHVVTTAHAQGRKGATHFLIFTPSFSLPFLVFFFLRVLSAVCLPERMHLSAPCALSLASSHKQFLGSAIDADNSGFVEVEELM